MSGLCHKKAKHFTTLQALKTTRNVELHNFSKNVPLKNDMTYKKIKVIYKTKQNKKLSQFKRP